MTVCRRFHTALAAPSGASDLGSHQLAYAWPFSEGSDMRPRGGSTNGS